MTLENFDYKTRSLRMTPYYIPMNNISSIVYDEVFLQWLYIARQNVYSLTDIQEWNKSKIISTDLLPKNINYLEALMYTYYFLGKMNLTPYQPYDPNIPSFWLPSLSSLSSFLSSTSNIYISDTTVNANTVVQLYNTLVSPTINSWETEPHNPSEVFSSYNNMDVNFGTPYTGYEIWNPPPSYIFKGYFPIYIYDGTIRYILYTYDQDLRPVFQLVDVEGNTVIKFNIQGEIIYAEKNNNVINFLVLTYDSNIKFYTFDLTSYALVEYRNVSIDELTKRFWYDNCLIKGISVNGIMHIITYNFRYKRFYYVSIMTGNTYYVKYVDLGETNIIPSIYLNIYGNVIVRSENYVYNFDYGNNVFTSYKIDSKYTSDEFNKYKNNYCFYVNQIEYNNYLQNYACPDKLNEYVRLFSFIPHSDYEFGEVEYVIPSINGKESAALLHDLITKQSFHVFDTNYVVITSQDKCHYNFATPTYSGNGLASNYVICYEVQNPEFSYLTSIINKIMVRRRYFLNKVSVKNVILDVFTKVFKDNNVTILRINSLDDEKVEFDAESYVVRLVNNKVVRMKAFEGVDFDINLISKDEKLKESIDYQEFDLSVIANDNKYGFSFYGLDYPITLIDKDNKIGFSFSGVDLDTSLIDKYLKTGFSFSGVDLDTSLIDMIKTSKESFNEVVYNNTIIDFDNKFGKGSFTGTNLDINFINMIKTSKESFNEIIYNNAIIDSENKFGKGSFTDIDLYTSVFDASKISKESFNEVVYNNAIIDFNNKFGKSYSPVSYNMNVIDKQKEELYSGKYIPIVMSKFDSDVKVSYKSNAFQYSMIEIDSETPLLYSQEVFPVSQNTIANLPATSYNQTVTPSIIRQIISSSDSPSANAIPSIMRQITSSSDSYSSNAIPSIMRQLTSTSNLLYGNATPLDLITLMSGNNSYSLDATYLLYSNIENSNLSVSQQFEVFYNNYPSQTITPSNTFYITYYGKPVIFSVGNVDAGSNVFFENDKQSLYLNNVKDGTLLVFNIEGVDGSFTGFKQSDLLVFPINEHQPTFIREVLNSSSAYLFDVNTNSFAIKGKKESDIISFNLNDDTYLKQGVKKESDIISFNLNDNAYLTQEDQKEGKVTSFNLNDNAYLTQKIQKESDIISFNLNDIVYLTQKIKNESSVISYPMSGISYIVSEEGGDGVIISVPMGVATYGYKCENITLNNLITIEPSTYISYPSLTYSLSLFTNFPLEITLQRDLSPQVVFFNNFMTISKSQPSNNLDQSYNNLNQPSNNLDQPYNNSAYGSYNSNNLDQSSNNLDQPYNNYAYGSSNSFSNYNNSNSIIYYSNSLENNYVYNIQFVDIINRTMNMLNSSSNTNFVNVNISDTKDLIGLFHNFPFNSNIMTHGTMILYNRVINYDTNIFVYSNANTVSSRLHVNSLGFNQNSQITLNISSATNTYYYDVYTRIKIFDELYGRPSDFFYEWFQEVNINLNPNNIENFFIQYSTDNYQFIIENGLDYRTVIDSIILAVAKEFGGIYSIDQFFNYEYLVNVQKIIKNFVPVHSRPLTILIQYYNDNIENELPLFDVILPYYKYIAYDILMLYESGGT